MSASGDYKQEALLKETERKARLQNEQNNTSPIEYKLEFGFKPTQAIPESFFQNAICTSKYTLLTAFPLILFQQMCYIGNIYFLVLAVLQMLPWVSQSGGSPILLIPLILVIGVNGLKDFIEDRKRKNSDEQENNNPCIIYSEFDKKNCKWSDVKPGDIVMTTKDQYFPADLCLLYSSNANGVAFVETKNLDGETNLKYKEASRNIYKVFTKNVSNKKEPIIDDKKHHEIQGLLSNLRGELCCSYPTPEMYTFNGTCKIYMTDLPKLQRSDGLKTETIEQQLQSNSRQSSQIENLDSVAKSQDYFAIDYNNLLLRGSSLRNTDFIIGFVIYTGHNSKIMLNSPNARTKTSKVSHTTNIQLKIIVVIQLVICLAYSIISVASTTSYEYNKIMKIQGGFLEWIYAFFVWLLAINNLVPISLLVTMEMIRYWQAIFIADDIKIYDRANGRGVLVQSSGLNEELGQVHNIFTDKTGTLTKNFMQFKYMIIGNQCYGSDNHASIDEIQRAGVTNVDFNDPQLFKDWENDKNPIQSCITNYVLALALCHTVIPELKDDKIIFNASSPDELSLVNAAKFFGADFYERNDENEILIRFQGKVLKYKLIHVIEFNSDRKRMSVLVKDLATNDVKLITKGADSHIKPLLKDNTNVDYTIGQLEKFGTKGLRTLLVTERIIPDDVYEMFNRKYKNSLRPENALQKITIMEECYEALEKDLILLGATAIEDCLQDDLESTLHDIKNAGIKIWMLTGDHPVTAISIGHSSGLLNPQDKAIICDSNDKRFINEKLNAANNINEKVCLVLTGEALIEIMKPDSHGLLKLFTEVLSNSLSVICSRVSPKQKADIVTFIKNIDSSKICLAIGDGANDVNMINVADVGIGIYGNEGQQAARASDYAIAQFSFLRRLLFVHGYECYRKNTFAVCYILWKNFLYTLPIILFAIESYGSGQLIYDPMMDTFYNIVFTAFPIGWYAVADHEIDWDILEKGENIENYYQAAMKNRDFNASSIIRWYLYAATSGCFLVIIHRQVYAYTITFFSHDMYDLWTVGTSIYTCIVMIVNFKIIFESNIHTVYTVLLIVFSLGSYILIFVLGSYFFTTWRIFYVWNMLVYSLHFWAVLCLILLSYFAIEYGWRSTKIYWEYLRLKMLENLKKKKTTHQSRLLISDEDMKQDWAKNEGYLYTDYTGHAYENDKGYSNMIVKKIETHTRMTMNLGIDVFE